LTTTKTETTTPTGKSTLAADEFASAVRDQAAESLKQGQEIATLLRDQTIASIKQAQQLTLESISAWSTAFGKFNGQLPQLPGFPSLPPLPVEGFSKTIEAGFDVAQELLSAQRQLAVTALGALASPPAAA
jgi:hypothetical protein